MADRTNWYLLVGTGLPVLFGLCATFSDGLASVGRNLGFAFGMTVNRLALATVVYWIMRWLRKPRAQAARVFFWIVAIWMLLQYSGARH
jgi:hypothetical protein